MIKKIIRKIRTLLTRYSTKWTINKRLTLPQNLFDEEWYIATSPDLGNVKDLWKHYLSTGGFEGRNPSPLFDSAWYLDTYPDVRLSKINPLMHYLDYGAAEGRDPSPYFHALWYIKEYSLDSFGVANPLLHYLRNNQNGVLSPNPFFYSEWYINKYPEVRSSGIDPIIYFIKYGEAASHSPNPFFNQDWYQAKNVDLSANDPRPFRNFLAVVKSEGRLPEPHPNHFTSTDAINKRLAALAPSTQPVACSAFLELSSLPLWLAAHNSSQEGEIVFAQEDRSSQSIVPTLFPRPAYVAKLLNSKVLAGSRYILPKGNVVLHDEEQYFYNIEGSALKYNKAQRIGNGWLSIKFNIRQAAWIETGINVMHEYACNYFHFIAETVPRMVLAEEAALPPDVPYLFEDNLHSNIRSILERVNSALGKRKIIWLQSGTIYNVHTLYMPSDVTTVVDAYHGGDVAKQSALDVSRVRTGIQSCKNLFKSNRPILKRKIFAARDGNVRKLLNQQLLEERLVELGFEIIRCDALDLDSQIQIFRGADIVIGPTGAQMSNIVWCDPDTKVIILASDHPSHQLYIWELLGRVSDAKVQIIQGPRAYVRDDKYSVHDDYTIDIEDVIAALIV